MALANHNLNYLGVAAGGITLAGVATYMYTANRVDPDLLLMCALGGSQEGLPECEGLWKPDPRPSRVPAPVIFPTSFYAEERDENLCYRDGPGDYPLKVITTTVTHGGMHSDTAQNATRSSFLTALHMCLSALLAFWLKVIYMFTTVFDSLYPRSLETLMAINSILMSGLAAMIMFDRLKLRRIFGKHSTAIRVTNSDLAVLRQQREADTCSNQTRIEMMDQKLTGWFAAIEEKTVGAKLLWQSSENIIFDGFKKLSDTNRNRFVAFEDNQASILSRIDNAENMAKVYQDLFTQITANATNENAELKQKYEAVSKRINTMEKQHDEYQKQLVDSSSKLEKASTYIRSLEDKIRAQDKAASERMTAIEKKIEEPASMLDSVRMRVDSLADDFHASEETIHGNKEALGKLTAQVQKQFEEYSKLRLGCIQTLKNFDVTFNYVVNGSFTSALKRFEETYKPTAEKPEADKLEPDELNDCLGAVLRAISDLSRSQAHSMRLLDPSARSQPQSQNPGIFATQPMASQPHYQTQAPGFFQGHITASNFQFQPQLNQGQQHASYNGRNPPPRNQHPSWSQPQSFAQNLASPNDRGLNFSTHAMGPAVAPGPGANFAVGSGPVMSHVPNSGPWIAATPAPGSSPIGSVRSASTTEALVANNSVAESAPVGSVKSVPTTEVPVAVSPTPKSTSGPSDAVTKPSQD
jgi:hypothetical protein